MTTRREVVREGCGVVLRKMELVNDGAVVSKAYHLETLRTPETWIFSSFAEADAAYLKELGLSEASELVAQRLAAGRSR
jgi:hypothetical protein